MRIAGLVVLALFGAMFARLWYLQILNSASYQAAVATNQVRYIYEQGPRGLIYDRNGNVLVDNQVTTTVTLQRNQAGNAIVAGRLAALLGIPTLRVDEQMTNPLYSPYKPVPVQSNVTPDKVLYIKEHQSEFPGVGVELDTQRHYPQGTTAAHILGYVGDINSAELAAHAGQGYRQGDQIGKDGVEASYETWLKGKAGVTKLEVNARGQVVSTVGVTPPVPGDNVQLTIDLGLQQATEADLASQILALRGTTDPTNGQPVPAPAGAAVVLDAQTGQVLAMASYPTYSPSDFVGGISKGRYAFYQAPVSAAPLLNRAIDGLYAPGSTFKLATATAALDSGLINSSYTYADSTGSFTVPNCTGQCTFHDDDSSAAGVVNVTKALTVSDDVFFYNLGYQFWNDRGTYGQTPVQDVATQYGLGQLSGIPLPNEGKGWVGGPTVQANLHREKPAAYPVGNWVAGDNIEMAFGQGITIITPLQLANAYATFGNGGTRYQPQVTDQILDQAGKVVHKVDPVAVAHVSLPPSTFDPMLAGFEGVTVDGTAGGTFAGFDQSNFQVAGKTGTASAQPNKEPTSLFAAFAPASNPQYAVGVVIEQAGYGATGAAVVTRNILAYLQQHPIGPVTPPSSS